MLDVLAFRKDYWLFKLSSLGPLPSLSILNPQPTIMGADLPPCLDSKQYEQKRTKGTKLLRSLRDLLYKF